ncbi:hypothetical protein GQ457_13G017100 [Hibiscus cannabinus]
MTVVEPWDKFIAVGSLLSTYLMLSCKEVSIPIPRYDLIEGYVDRRDRLSAQPSSSRSTQPRESVITEDSCRFSPDQTGNPLRPKAFPWVGFDA